MRIYQFCLLLILATLFPPLARAEEMDMQAGSVRIHRDSQGNINIDTGKTNLNLPAQRTSINRTRRVNDVNSRNRIVNPRVPKTEKTIIRNPCTKSGSVTSQTITQMSTVSGGGTQASRNSVSCR